MKKLLLIAVVGAVLFYLNRGPAQAPSAPASGVESIAGDFSAQQSGALVTGEGRVSRILGDDSIGDTVAFHGEFEWNDKGGVVHWTHHDPQGSRESGWLKHAGRTYQ